MASSFHNQPTTTSPPIEPTMSSPFPSSEYNNSSMNPQPIYPFSISNPWILLDPMFPSPYPSTQYNDPHLWAGTNHPLFGQGPAFPNYNYNAETSSWMMNLGQPAFSSPPIEVVPSSTLVEVQPETVIRDSTATEELTSGGDQHATPRNASKPSTFRCKWEGCTYAGTFVIESSLWRHIKSTHLAPDSLKCPAPRCKKSFGRRDKYNAHVRLVHQDIADLLDAPEVEACA